MKYRIFIDYGYSEEFDLIDNAVFSTKEEAKEFCRTHKFPFKCIMSQAEFDKMSAIRKRICIGPKKS